MTIKLKRTRTAPVSLAHVIALVVAAFSVLLIVGFGIRAANHIRVQSELAVADAELARAEMVRDSLQQRLDYVQSDAYVEEVARTQLKWSRPGETAVVIVSPPPAAPVEAEPGPAPMPAPISDDSSWLNWWFLFFDGPPPRIF